MFFFFNSFLKILFFLFYFIFILSRVFGQESSSWLEDHKGYTYKWNIFSSGFWAFCLPRLKDIIIVFRFHYKEYCNLRDLYRPLGNK